jgi:CheY-like chemotaxis protein
MEKFAPVKRSEDGQPVRYLIVDDSVFARKNLARMVETFGGQVVGEAGDGVSAISEYARLTPDIVLMDITMPQMEGIEAAEKIVRDHPAPASSWCRRSAIRKTSWPPCSAAPATSCRNR